MFNGSEHFNTDYFKALGAMGATDLNGTTDRDRTNYFQTVPTSGLDRVLFLESDRMGHLLGVIDQARLDEQRGVVQNEKRQGENQPYGQVFNEANKVLFPSHHPYAFPRGTVIGSMEDLEAASLKDVQEWFRTWYGPNNATLVVAGDVDPKVVLEKVTKYFGHIPASKPVVKLGPWVPRLEEPVTKVIEDRVPQTRLYRFWVVPERTNAAHDYLDMAADVFMNGKTSRLFKRLVYTEQLCTDVGGGVWSGEIASQFILSASVKPGVDPATVVKVLDEEFAKFLKDGPTADELARLKSRQLAGFVRGLERIGGFGGKSDVLADSQVYGGKPDAWKDSVARLEAATPKDVHQAVKAWLAAPALSLTVQPFGTYKNASAGVDRKKLPDLGPAPAVAFPALERATLKNGLKVVLARRPGLPLVDLRLRFDVGTSADTKDTAGLATLAMNLLDEGTKTKTPIQLAEELEKLGAGLGSGADLDTSALTVNSLKATFPQALALLGEVLLTPKLDPKDFTRLQQQQLAGIKQEKNSPGGMATRLAPRLYFGDGHPYALPMSGSGFEQTVSKLTLADVQGWLSKSLKPGSATVAVVGDLSLFELEALLEKTLGGWAAGAAPKVDVPTVALSDKPQVWLIDRPGSLQTVIAVGHLAPPTNNPDELAIEGFNKVIGGDFNSRLNMNLREDKHWSYGVRSSLTNAKGQRAFVVFAPVQTDKTKESLVELKKELTDYVGSRPTTTEEFDRIQADRVLKLPGQWETAGAVQGALAYLLNYGLPDTYFQTYADAVRGLKKDQLDAAAKKVLKPQSLVWVVVGDRAKVEEGVASLKLGELKFADADGTPVK